MTNKPTSIDTVNNCLVRLKLYRPLFFNLLNIAKRKGNKEAIQLASIQCKSIMEKFKNGVTIEMLDSIEEIVDDFRAQASKLINLIYPDKKQK